MSNQYIISVLVENHIGVLVRVSGLLTARGYNIESLAVGRTHDPEISRMTLVVFATNNVVEQIRKQLDKLVEVLQVSVYQQSNSVHRDLALIKVKVSNNRSEILEIVDIFRSRVIDVAQDSLTIEATGTESKIEALLDMIQPFAIVEVSRTGVIALTRGSEKFK